MKSADESNSNVSALTRKRSRAGKLLVAFRSGWRLQLQRVPPTPDMAASPLQPVLATATRLDPAQQHQAPPVELGFGPDASVPNAEHLADILKVCLHVTGQMVLLCSRPWCMTEQGLYLNARR